MSEKAKPPPRVFKLRAWWRMLTSVLLATAAVATFSASALATSVEAAAQRASVATMVKGGYFSDHLRKGECFVRSSKQREALLLDDRKALQVVSLRTREAWKRVERASFDVRPRFSPGPKNQVFII